LIIKGLKNGKPVILDDIKNLNAQTIEINYFLETNIKEKPIKKE
jgi:hypothetical protein